MMKTKLTKALLLTVIALMFIGCKKDEEKQDDSNSTPTPVSSKTDLLVGKNWKMTAWTLDDGSGVTTNLYELNVLPNPCQIDDFIKFSNDNTMITDRGAVLCASDQSQSTAPTAWSWSANETILTFENTSSTLIELTATTLKLQTVFVVDANSNPPVTYTKLKTYTKQ